MGSSLMINVNFLITNERTIIMENEKLMKTSRIIDKILKIAQGFLIAGFIIAVIFIPLTLILGEKIIADASTLSLGNISLDLAGDWTGYLDLAEIKFGIIVNLIAAIISCSVGWICFRKLRQILVPMKEGRPFELGISDNLRQFGWMTFVGGAVIEGSHMLGNILQTSAYDLQSIFSNPLIEGWNFNCSVNLWFVIVALVIFFLSFVFRYGEDLQKESDETL